MQAPAELLDQLTSFVRVQTGDATAAVAGLEVLPGHAGFSYGFTVTGRAERGTAPSESYVLRLPPPGVRYEGTADVLRQARILGVLHGGAVPVAPVRWSGADPRWFGRPYLIVRRLPGDTLRAGEGVWESYAAETLAAMAHHAVAALAALHARDWQTSLPEWGPPLDPEAAVLRWDRFGERAADPDLVKRGPEVRQRLLQRLPAAPRYGIVHGDFQWTNLLYDQERLVAVLDWELAGIGPVLNDLGWLLVFTDPANWTADVYTNAPLPAVDRVQAMYAEAAGVDPGDVRWHRALAGYAFAIIAGFNLMLHRRGKRDDPHWEVLAPSIPLLIDRAIDVLDGG